MQLNFVGIIIREKSTVSYLLWAVYACIKQQIIGQPGIESYSIPLQCYTSFVLLHFKGINIIAENQLLDKIDNWLQFLVSPFYGYMEV